MVFLTLASSPLAAWTVTRLGSRATLALGVVTASAGLLGAAAYIHLASTDRPRSAAASEANITSTTTSSSSSNSGHPNILVLYATVGLLTGLGFGLTYLPSMTVSPAWLWPLVTCVYTRPRTGKLKSSD